MGLSIGLVPSFAVHLRPISDPYETRTYLRHNQAVISRVLDVQADQTSGFNLGNKFWGEVQLTEGVVETPHTF